MMTKFYDLLCTTQKFIAFMFFTNVCVIWCFTLLFEKDKIQYSFLGAQYFCSYCWEKSIEEGDILIAWIFTHRMSQKSCLVWRIHSWIFIMRWSVSGQKYSSWTYWKISIPLMKRGYKWDFLNFSDRHFPLEKRLCKEDINQFLTHPQINKCCTT